MHACCSVPHDRCRPRTCSSFGGKPASSSWASTGTPVCCSISAWSVCRLVFGASPESVAWPVLLRSRTLHAMLADEPGVAFDCCVGWRKQRVATGRRHLQAVAPATRRAAGQAAAVACPAPDASGRGNSRSIQQLCCTCSSLRWLCSDVRRRRARACPACCGSACMASCCDARQAATPDRRCPSHL